MTPEQLGVLLDIANSGAILFGGDPLSGFEARKAAASDLVAMRTPIMADALEQAGWVHDVFEHEWYTRRIDGLIVEFNLAGEPAVLIETRAPGCRIIPECRTMYDLGELVRMLAERPDRR